MAEVVGSSVQIGSRYGCTRPIPTVSVVSTETTRNSSRQNSNYVFEDMLTLNTTETTSSNQHYNFILDYRYTTLDIMLLIHLWVILVVALPGICFAMYRLCSRIRSDVVYVINVLISDLIQIFANTINITLFYTKLASPGYCSMDIATQLTYNIAVLVNVYFMMCISVERYIMIAHALWYRTVRKIRTKVCACVAVWILSLSAIITPGVFIVLLAVPYIPMLFLFVGTWRALSQSQLPRHGQRRILAIQALILFIYTICFLPQFFYSVLSFRPNSWIPPMHYYIVFYSYRFLVALNPLFDLLLYVLVRTDDTGIFSAFCCWFCNRQRGSTATSADAGCTATGAADTATHVVPNQV